MNNWVFAIGLFFFGYLLNMFYITVLYHRALTHGAILLGPKMMKLLSLTGIWITGLDPKAWASMHRLHHLHSDTERDPHSPVQLGIMGVWIGQYVAYKEILKKLINKNDAALNKLIVDIPFDVSFLSRRELSSVPYLVHALIALVLGNMAGSTLIGVAYFLGIMSHPVQGWMVNALAHRFGSRNYATDDNSKNNFIVSLLVFGEGFQNNHHAHPKRANFAAKGMELDLGYVMCLVAEKLTLFKIVR
jgi:stearoyl-CoA desaturase (Delta-9 desaturase)